MRSPKNADATLSRVWDSLLEDAPPPPRLDPADLLTIQALYDIDDAPAPAVEDIDAIWSSIVAAAPQLQSHAEVAVATQPVWRTRLSGWLRTIFVAALAGFIAGFFVLGGGGRIVMRIVAMMAEPGMQGGTTENSFVVGEITLGGTFDLMLQGGLAGIGAGIAYVVIRRWLPIGGWHERLTMAAIMFMLVGSTALDNGDNPDYKRFGILGVNVCLFTLLPFLYGLAIGPVWQFCDRRISPQAASLHHGFKTGLLSVAIVAMMPIIAMVVLTTMFLVPPMALIFLTPLLEVGLRWWERRRQRSISSRGVTIARWVAVGVPCLVGFVMIVQSVQQLMNGA